jgi:hypothetical protein
VAARHVLLSNDTSDNGTNVDGKVAVHRLQLHVEEQALLGVSLVRQHAAVNAGNALVNVLAALVRVPCRLERPARKVVQAALNLHVKGAVRVLVKVARRQMNGLIVRRGRGRRVVNHLLHLRGSHLRVLRHEGLLLRGQQLLLLEGQELLLLLLSVDGSHVWSRVGVQAASYQRRETGCDQITIACIFIPS